MEYLLRISEEARFDIIDSFTWYESQKPLLGKSFEQCVESGLNEIIKNPLAYEDKFRGIRVHYINRFPFGIHYLINENIIFILAVFHTSRNPKSWESRLK